MKNLKRMAVVLLVMVLSLVLFTGCAEDDEQDPTMEEVAIFSVGMGCMGEVLADAAPGSAKTLIATNVNWTNAEGTAKVVGSGTYNDDFAVEDWDIADFVITFTNYYSADFEITLTGYFEYECDADSGTIVGNYSFDGNTASLNMSASDIVDGEATTITGTITINGTTFSASNFMDAMYDYLISIMGGKSKVKLPRFFKVK